MRKILLAITASIALVFSTLVSVAPANAVQVTGNWSFENTAVVGVYFGIQNGCEYQSGEMVSSLSYSYTGGQLPPGLSLDMWNGRIDGTPTQPGYYTISGYHCSTPSSSYGGSNDITFYVAPAATPYLVATPLNDSNCSVAISAYYPNNTLAGEAGNGDWLEASSGGSHYSWILGQHSASTADSLVVSNNNFQLTYANGGPTINRFDELGSIGCGDAVTYTLHSAWRFQGSVVPTDEPAVSDPVVATTPQANVAGAAAYLSVTPKNDADCSFDINVYVPAIADANSVTLTADNGTGSSGPNVVTLVSPTAGQTLHLVASSDNYTSILANNPTLVTSQYTPQSFNCGDAVNFSLDYSTAGSAATTATVTGVVATRATTPVVTTYLAGEQNPTVAASFIGGSECTLEVTGQFPTDWQSASINPRASIQNVDNGNNFIVFAPNQIAADGTWSVHIGLPTTASPDFSLIADGSGLVCGATYNAQSFYTLSSTNYSSAIAEVAAVEHVLCTAGTYSATGFGPSCISAIAGYYVGTTGATHAIPCPAGSFTSIPGQVECDATDPGHFAPYSGMSFQMQCPAGTFTNAFGDDGCSTVQIGQWSAAGATAAVNCPANTFTVSTGSTSRNDCLAKTAQTINISKLPKGLKFKKALAISKLTNQRESVTVTATGKCSVVSANSSTYNIVAGKNKGNCVVSITARSGSSYLALSISGTLKISKTGK